MSNVGTTKLTRPTLHFHSVCHVNFVVPTLDMAYPSPSCFCSRPTLHFPSVSEGKCKVEPLQRQLGEG
jgi:hypothetical protein